jgi:RND family efflux transporter MFP subunit
MSRRGSVLRTVVLSIVGLAILVAVIAWLSGVFTPKVDPGRVETGHAVLDEQVVSVEVRMVPEVTRAIGTIRAVHETAVGSRLLAPVEKVHVTAGQRVSEGDLLVELDEADLLARKHQAASSLDARQARLAKVTDDLGKVQQLHQRGAATEQELTDAQRAVEIARAETTTAEQQLAEVETQLSYARIRAPFDGVVIEKLVEAGDLARPGETLVTLYDPDRLQLEAPVPERLALGLSVGDTIEVEIEAIDLRCHGAVSEIVPQASPASRSLLVKVTGPCPPGVYSGMFGRMMIPSGERRQLLVPITAVRRVGQLEMVQIVHEEVAEGGDPTLIARRHFVRTGARSDDAVEILAGLEPGDRVLARFDAG